MAKQAQAKAEAGEEMAATGQAVVQGAHQGGDKWSLASAIQDGWS